MKNKYISLEQIARHKLQVKYPNDYHNGWNDAIDEILECQPANVAEVKHGYWAKNNESGYYECSICRTTKPYDGIDEDDPEKVVYWESLFCRGCGAKMTGVMKDA